MGCDIHTMAEYETDLYIPNPAEGESHWAPSGKWKAIKAQVFEYPYFRENEPISRFNERFTSAPYKGRNYELFSVLADVRNTRSFFNIFDPSLIHQERDSLLPIAQPRGIPEDASKAWKRECKAWGQDFHSHSWFTLTELIEARDGGAFEQTVVQRGWVGLRQYLRLKNEGIEPDSWSGGVGGGGIETLSEEQWDALSEDEKQRRIDAEDPDQGYFSKTYVAAKWSRNVKESLSYFVDTTIEALRVNAPRSVAVEGYREFDDDGNFVRWVPPGWEYDTDRIRLVFAFDN